MSLPAAVPAGQDFRGLAASGPVIGPFTKDPSHAAKLNQVVQNFFSKAAQVIIQSRMLVNLVILPVNPVITDQTIIQKKINKWFNLEVDDMDTFRDELRLWKAADAALVTSSFASLPPLLIETVLDTRDLTANQTLVVLDDEGQRWNVDAAAAAGGLRADVRRPEIVLERWRIELDPRSINALGLPPELPVVYKKSIVLFRSLYAYVRLLPAWRFRKKLSKAKLNPSSLKISCRVLNGAYPVSSRGRIGLSMPLVLDRKDDTQNHTFKKIDTPAGAFTVHVTYRKNCEFRVDDSESILSSHFLNLDEHSTRKYANTAAATASARRYSRTSKTSPANSLPSAHSPSREVSQLDPGLSYGSLSSFHHQSIAVPGASPLSALRGTATGTGHERESSLTSSLSTSAPRNITSGTRKSLNQIDTGRPAVQPFKSPALSASPSSDPMAPGGGSYPRLSYRRGSASSSISSYQQRAQRSSFSSTFSGGQRQSTSVSPVNTFNPSAALAISTSSASSAGSRPESGRRYSSSFGSRSQWQHGSTSSSSATVAAQHAVVDGSAGGSGTPSDDDNELGEFVRMLDSRRPLKSFATQRESDSVAAVAGVGMGTSAPRTSLARFQQLRDSHAFLSDSMSASVVVQQRSPALISGSCSSTGSGGSGKAISPHTPHTPAIPSRLSEGLTAEYYCDQPVFEDEDDDDGALDDDDDDDDDGGVPRRRAVKKPGPGLARHDEEDELRPDDADSSMSLASAPQTQTVTVATANSNSCSSGGLLRGSIAKRAALRSSPSAGSVHSNEVSSHGGHFGDDDELLFAMSDMVIGSTTTAAPILMQSPKEAQQKTQPQE
ncbi:autophagy-related protein 13-domain-containing protein [Lipomyces chichibuensis]|uniref:autophagy-related protein 13-domain-containing protein n=1 Tax=Lipomyces chichibuensis TaxID=1546026 RepID=UPI0033438C1C